MEVIAAEKSDANVPHKVTEWTHRVGVSLCCLRSEIAEDCVYPQQLGGAKSERARYKHRAKPSPIKLPQPHHNFAKRYKTKENLNLLRTVFTLKDVYGNSNRDTSSDGWFSGMTKTCWDECFEYESRVELSANTKTPSEDVDWDLSYLEEGSRSNGVVSTPEFARRLGMVFIVHISKTGWKSFWFSLQTSFETVAGWLNHGSKYTLPISVSSSPRRWNLASNFQTQTIMEALGDHLNPEQEGITFFVGPVEGKMSFKMSISELSLLKKACDALMGGTRAMAEWSPS